jgi:four helix bundle suffix protein
MKLTNVARASLEELRLDYEDFLRQHGLPLWPAQDPRRAELIARRPVTADEVATWVKKAGRNGRDGRYGRNGRSMASMKSMASTRMPYAELSANAALALLAVACSLLDRQLAAQAACFEKEGGFTERLFRRRSGMRD